MKKISLLLISAAMPAMIFSQTWERNFGGTNTEYGYAVIQTSDGGFAAAGYTNVNYGSGGKDVYVVKTDANGQLQWQQVIGGVADDIGYAIAQNASGEIYVAGQTNSFATDNNDVYLVKLGASGNLLWTNHYGGAQTDYAKGIALTAAGDVIIAGGTSSFGSGGSDVYIIKVNSSGVLQWSKTYGTTGNEFANAIDNIHDGGFVVAGYTNGYASNYGYAVRTNSIGDSLWTKAFNIGPSLTNNQLYGVKEMANLTEIVYCGQGSGSSYYNDWKAVHLKTDLNGVVFYTNFSNNTFDGSYSLTLTSDGGYATSGFYSSYRVGLKKFNSTGIQQWERTFQMGSGFSYSDFSRAYSVKEITGGGFIMSGYTRLTGNSDLLLIKANAQGTGQIYPTPTVTANGPTTICSNSSVTLSVMSGFNSYQWWSSNPNQYYYANVIAGATSSSYTPVSSGNYFCVMTNSSGMYVSNYISVTVTPVPTASVTPSGPLSFCAVSAPQSLSCNSITGATYQWNLNGSPVTGATTSSYSPASPGNYDVTITNSCGTASSNVVIVNSTTQPPTNISITGWAYVEEICDNNIYGPSYCPSGTLSTDNYPGAIYTWTSVPDCYCSWNANGNTLVPPIPASYTVTVSNGCGAATSSPYNVPLYQGYCPDIHPTAPTSGCDIASVTLEADNYYNYYQWYVDGNPISNATSYSYVATTSGSYTCGISYTCGYYPYNSYVSILTDPVVVTIGTSTPSITATGNTTVCSGTVALSASPAGSTYQWIRDNQYYVGTTQTINATLSGNYHCIITNAACGETHSNSIFVSIGLPSGSIYASPNYICAGSSSTLTVSTNFPALTYQWRLNGTDIPGATATTYSATLGGNYDCVLTNSCGSYITNTVALLVRPMPTATIIPAGNFVLCPSASITLSAYNDVGYTFQWRINGYGPYSTASSYNATQAGRYTVVVSLNGCTATSSPDTITAGTLPMANIWPSSLTDFCSPGSVQLNANQGTAYSFQWFNNNSAIPGAVQQTYIASVSGNYSVKITNAAGCSASASAVTVNDNTIGNLVINANGPNAFCFGDSVQLSSSAAATVYQWSQNNVVIPSATSSSYYADTSGFYSLSIMNAAGCIGSASTGVVASAAPNVTITPNGPTTLCTSTNISLSVPSVTGNTYQWYLNNNPITYATSNMYSTNSVSGTYSVVVSAPGCSASSTGVAVTFLPQPTATVTASGPTTFCVGGHVIFTASSGPAYTYQWYFNSTIMPAETLQVCTAAVGGYYRVVVTGANSCTASSFNQNVTVVQLPPANIATNNPTVTCTPGTVTMSTVGSSSLTYQWRLNNNNIPGATSNTYTANATGSYTCAVTNICGTTISNTIAVTINQTPVATITAGGPVTFCENGSVLLTSTTGPGYTYQWYRNYSAITGATGSVYSAATTGNYYVRIVSSGCYANSNTISVTVNPLPTANIYHSGSLTVCSPSSVSLYVYTGTGWTYQWRKNALDIPGATNTSYSANSSGVYDCVVTNSCGSAISNTRTVVVNTQPVASITASGATNFCSPASVTLNATTGSGYSYQWRLNNTSITGAVTSSYTATSTGNYNCYVFNSCGSVLSNTIFVNANATPTSASISAGGPTTFCLPGSVVLNAIPSSGFLYQWRLNNVNITGANSSSYSAGASGIYSCNVYNNCGSVVSNTLTVTTSSAPATPGSITGATVNVCSSSFTYSIGAVAGATSYTWAVPSGATLVSGQGTTSAVISFPPGFLSGTISVTANNICGAGSPSLRTVSGVPANAGAISGPVSVCHNQNQVYYSIAPVAGATNYAWTVPQGAHIQQGQGTVQIRMKFGQNAGNITVQASSGCGASAVSSLAVAMPCREDEMMTENISGVIAYPNPADKVVSLKFFAEKKCEAAISLLDVSGRLLREEIYSAEEGENIFNADVSLFAPGVYLVSAQINKQVQMLKVVKE